MISESDIKAFLAELASCSFIVGASTISALVFKVDDLKVTSVFFTLGNAKLSCDDENAKCYDSRV